MLIKVFNRFTAKTYDPFTINGSGIYTDDDWAITRKKSEELFRNPNEFNYLTSLFSSPDKIKVAYQFNSKYDLKKFNRIGDVGGLPFFQNLVLSHLNPKIKFILTDFDEKSLFSIKSIELLKNFEFKLFNAKKDNLSFFDECDLITMWGVDPCLEDEHLLPLFSYIKKRNIKLIMCSLECDNPIFKIKMLVPDKLKNIIRNKQKSGRDHIILRTKKYFEYLAKSRNLTVKKLFVSDIYVVYEIS